MEKNIIWQVIVLAFGLMVVGCDSEPIPILEISNFTEDNITEVAFFDRPNRYGLFKMQDSSGIPAHTKKSYEIIGRTQYYVSLIVKDEIVFYFSYDGTEKPIFIGDDNLLNNSAKTYTEYIALHKTESGEYYIGTPY